MGALARPAAGRRPPRGRQGRCAAMVEECAGRGVRYPDAVRVSAARTGAGRPTRSGMLMRLFLDALEREIDDLHRNGVRLRFIGDRASLGGELSARMAAAEALTRGQSGARACWWRWPTAAAGTSLQACRSLAARCAAGNLHAAGASTRTPVARAPRACRHAGSRSAHPHGRRAAHQQFPAVESRLHRAVLHRCAVAGFRSRRARCARSTIFAAARAPLRADVRAARCESGAMLRMRILTALGSARDAARVHCSCCRRAGRCCAVRRLLRSSVRGSGRAFGGLRTAARLAYCLRGAIASCAAVLAACRPAIRGALVLLVGAGLWWVVAFAVARACARSGVAAVWRPLLRRAGAGPAFVALSACDLLTTDCARPETRALAAAVGARPPTSARISPAARSGATSSRRA